MTLGGSRSVSEDVEVHIVTPEQIGAVRDQLDQKYREQCDDRTVARFLRATDVNLPLAAKRLQATCTWREENKPTEMVCTACAKDPRSHYMRIAGHCNHGRPIIYSCIALASDKSYEDNRAHMISTFETAVKCMTGSVEQWIWVCDFYGFGYKDINVKLAKLFLEVSANHYPERLGMFMLVGVPALFSVLWNAIEAWVDPKTKKKIRFVPFDIGKKEKSKLQHELSLHFDPETTTWLINEMSENRDRTAADQKLKSSRELYGYRELHRMAEQKALLKEAEADRSVGKHNCRGCKPLLSLLEADPSILQPQADAPM